MLGALPRRVNNVVDEQEDAGTRNACLCLVSGVFPGYNRTPPIRLIRLGIIPKSGPEGFLLEESAG